MPILKTYIVKDRRRKPHTYEELHDYIVNRSALRISSDGCWEWMLAVKNNGYGVARINGRVYHMHRILLEYLTSVDIPEGMEVDHICRNRRCCNANHLRVVTKRQNRLENNASPFAKAYWSARGVEIKLLPS